MKKLLIASLALFTFALITFASAEDFSVAGSSTVYPVTLAVAEEFNIETGVNVEVSSTGTGGGFRRFCAGETAINNASRPIKQKEIDDCAANGITPIELPVAYDALTVAVNPENDWATCMTTLELKMLWEPGSIVTYWSDIRDGWPEEKINLYGPASTSGTFDYFTEVIVGQTGASRTDYFPSEEDDILAENVHSDKNGLLYVGYAYYINDTERLRAVAINSIDTDPSAPDFDDNCITPSVENIENGTYTPLSRPLFIYVSDVALNSNPDVRSFANFYFAEEQLEIIGDVGYARLDDDVYEANLAKVQ